MNTLFDKHRKLLIGVVHLQPLPGSPRWRGDMDSVIKFAVNDARAYERGGAHALFVENFGDVPFTKGSVAPETIAAMAAAGRAIRQAVKLPDRLQRPAQRRPRRAGALCAVCGGAFVRVNVHTGAMLTDQGLIEGNAYETLRYRQRVCPRAQIFADVHVKHAVPLGNWTIEDAARDTVERGLADALIVSGAGTGLAGRARGCRTRPPHLSGHQDPPGQRHDACECARLPARRGRLHRRQLTQARRQAREPGGSQTRRRARAGTAGVQSAFGSSAEAHPAGSRHEACCSGIALALCP